MKKIADFVGDFQHYEKFAHKNQSNFLFFISVAFALRLMREPLCLFRKLYTFFSLDKLENSS